MSTMMMMMEEVNSSPVVSSDAEICALVADDSVRPFNSRDRLYKLFGHIEKEFEALFADNLTLQAKVEALTEKLTEGGALAPEKAAEILNITAADVVAGRKQTGSGKKAASQVGQRLRTALRVPPPGKFVSSFKAGLDAGRRPHYVAAFAGHRDGVWHVRCPISVTGAQRQLVGSASADQTARLWAVESGECLLSYTGHAGSVNSISFCPRHQFVSDLSDLLVVTASGDQSAHVWRPPAGALGHSSEDELEPPAAADKEEGPSSAAALDDYPTGGPSSSSRCARTTKAPLVRLTGHTGVVIAADWLCSADQVITASWDRTANIYDAERGEIVSMLSGHDQELTFCHAHSSQKLVVTSSKDTTFRLWDFREPIHSVAVFQGHVDSVTSAVFSSGDKVVSGSDDRTVKVWDLKNMRSSLTTLRLDSAANRLAVSARHNVIAIPHDNRHVRLYDLQGNRLARLPRANRRCHRRMVCAAAWADDNPVANLLTCGFDKMIISWKVVTPT